MVRRFFLFFNGLCALPSDMRLIPFHKFVGSSAPQKMDSRKLLWAGFALMVATFSNFAEGQVTNLLSNPSFENTSTAPWKLTSRRTKAAVTQTDSVDGMHALAIPTDGEASQEISLTAGVYELRAFVRPGAGQVGKLTLSCRGDLQSEVSTNTPDPSSPPSIRASSRRRDADWQELHVPVVFLYDSRSCSVAIRVMGNADALTFVDSVSLTRHDNLLSNPELLSKQRGWKLEGIRRGSKGPVLLKARGQSEKESTLFQTVKLSPGEYTLAASYRSSGGQSLARLEATGCGPEDFILNLAPASLGKAYRRVKLRGIRVTNAECDVGVRVRSAGGQWLRISNLTLEPDKQPYQMLAGGDVTLTDMVEEHGGVYKFNGIASDPFHILAESGMNLARLHLFVDPGNPEFSPSRKMQGSYADLSHVLRLAARAQATGMKIELALHLSDYWADGGCQTQPHAWVGLGPDALVEAVGSYVGGVLLEFQKIGIPVDYIAIGNEADAGLLRSAECKSALLPVDADASANPDLLARIYDGAYGVVHAASPKTIVLWHLANIGRYAETRWYLDSMFSRGARVDMLAYSAYPFWSRLTVRQFQDFCNYVTARYHRPVFLEESGYPWAPAAGADNMTDGGPEPYPMTPEGQLDFLDDEISAIQSADEGQVIGFSYWDATWIPTPGTFDNVDNYVLFDRGGNALPALTTGFRLRMPKR
jgi:arabinogalactan endo-1,4-beta-galactosidase